MLDRTTIKVDEDVKWLHNKRLNLSNTRTTDRNSAYALRPNQEGIGQTSVYTVVECSNSR